MLSSTAPNAALKLCDFGLTICGGSLSPTEIELPGSAPALAGLHVLLCCRFWHSQLTLLVVLSRQCPRCGCCDAVRPF